LIRVILKVNEKKKGAEEGEWKGLTAPWLDEGEE
jgi:hypothetical protein